MSAEKRVSLVGYGITACVYLAVTLWLTGAFGSITGDEMGVWLLGLYVIIPVTSLITGVVLGAKNAFLKWLYPVVFGACGVLIPHIATGVLTFEMVTLVISFTPALLGVSFGVLIRKARTQ